MRKLMTKNKGFLFINKPKDWTSFDVVNKVKHLLKFKKVGHLGTLDPMATGVLIITIGKATKLFDFLQKKKKTYIAKFEFGYSTDTLDSTGRVVDRIDKIPTIEEIENVIPKFIGEINQIPPKYSAKSIDGKRAYDLARQNIDFELKPKLVNIYDIKLLKYENNVMTMKIICGSGTYIRAIGRDMANALNSCATMTELVRTNIGKVSIDDCLSLDKLDENNIQNFIVPVNEFLDCPILNLSIENGQKLLNGQFVLVDAKDGVYKYNLHGDTIALIKVSDFRAKMMIYLGD